MKRQKAESDSGVLAALREAIDLIQLKSEDAWRTRLAAAQDLAEIQSIPSQDFLAQLLKDSPAGSTAGARRDRSRSSTSARTLQIGQFLRHRLSRRSRSAACCWSWPSAWRLPSALMGVINMAHGELIAVGAYTTYVVQNVFGGRARSLSPFGLLASVCPA